MVGADALDLLCEARVRRWVYDAMTCAVPAELLDTPDKHSQAGHPWLTFVAFHFRQSSIPETLLGFVADMVNREEITDAIMSCEFPPGAYLIRLPLPLSSSVGKIVTVAEFAVIDQILSRLRALRNEIGHRDHRQEVRRLVAESILPIEIAHTDSLILIARDDNEYSYRLE